MITGTPILLGDYFENFVNQQIKSASYTSRSEVVTTALRLFEQHVNNSKNLIDELIVGEKSGMITDFDRKNELAKLHAKYS